MSVRVAVSSLNVDMADFGMDELVGLLLLLLLLLFVLYPRFPPGNPLLWARDMNPAESPTRRRLGEVLSGSASPVVVDPSIV